MNVVLFDADEVSDSGAVTLRGRRARHLRDVLRVTPGRQVRVGIFDGPLGRGEVEAVTDDSVTLRCAFRDVVIRPAADVLLLAVPRPRVLRRVLEDAASLGFGRIVLLRTWRVDKSHLESRAMTPTERHAHLVLGLEQGGRTHVPRVEVQDRFKPFVEDSLDASMPGGARFVADPTGEPFDAGPRAADDATGRAIAIGPERGFTPYELGMLVERGFRPTRVADATLRVETAVAVAWSKLIG